MFYEDDRVRAAAERVARLESWQKLESDPAKLDDIARALDDARDTFRSECERAAREKAEREAAEKAKDGKGNQMFPDGSVTDFLKALDKAGTEKQQAEATAKAAGDAQEQPKADSTASATADADQVKELERLRELEPPKEITDLPEYKALYEEGLQRYAEEAEAIAGEISAGQSEPRPEDVPELQPGDEVSGVVLTVNHRDDVIIYIVRDDDGMLTALHDDAKEPKFPDLEKGDAIAASRDRDDGEYTVSQGDDYGM